jgi:uncharacterized membrane protein
MARDEELAKRESARDAADAAAEAALAGPAFPNTRSEFITVLAHYHRAEIARMAGWRDRIDRTTNWAITVVGAMLSVSLSTPTAHHGVVLFAMVLVLLLLVIESRRYRFFDVYRNRVRRLERNYYARIFAPAIKTETDWMRTLGEDLRRPIFLIGRKQAMARRMRRNYGWMFAILLVAWLLKITSPKLQAGGAPADFALSPGEWIANAAIGPLPGWIVAVSVAVFYLWVGYTALHRAEREAGDGNVHV